MAAVRFALAAVLFLALASPAQATLWKATGLHTTSVASTSVGLDWDSDPSGTRLNYWSYLYTDTHVQRNNEVTSATTIQGLTPCTSYTFRVSAQFASGGPLSDPVSATTTGCTSSVTWPNGWGSWVNWPDSTWRPYADRSPVNQPYGDSTAYRANDAAMVVRARNNHAMNPQWLPVGSNDWAHPYYFNHSTDPLYTVHCTRYACPTMEGQQVRIPTHARPAGGGDAHMTIFDQSTNYEWDFWKSSVPSGSTLNVAGGGKMPVSGDGTASAGNGANAANTGLFWGTIRPEELAGVIPHALSLVVYCTSGYVYPASGNARQCSSVGQSNTNAPPDGQLFKLAYTDAEIAALPIPAWKKAIVTALAHYGGYVQDTGGAGGIGIQFQSQQTYASYGSSGGWNQFLGRPDVIGSTNNVEFEINLGVDWSRLHAVDPCVPDPGC